MTKIQVDVPDSILGEEKAKEIKSLKQKVIRLEMKVRDLQRELAEAREHDRAYRDMLLFVKDNFNLYEDDQF